MCFNKAPTTSERRVLNHFSLACSFRERIPKSIIWSCPKTGYALHVDGAAKGNPGPTGGGGCIRGSKGELIHGFSYYYGVGTNMMAEARALLDGMRILEKSKLLVDAIFYDSKVLLNMIRLRYRPPWRILKWWDDIKSIIDKHGWRVQHTYREGNMVTDALASLACSTRLNQDFRSWKELPRSAHGCAIVDAVGLPSWRR